MAHIVDWNIVMLAPEERSRSEGSGDTHHIEGRDLSLPLCDHPMLDAEAFAGNRIRPAGDIAGSINFGGAGCHMLVDAYALVDREPGHFSERQARTYSDADHH